MQSNNTNKRSLMERITTLLVPVSVIVKAIITLIIAVYFGH